VAVFEFLEGQLEALPPVVRGILAEFGGDCEREGRLRVVAVRCGL